MFLLCLWDILKCLDYLNFKFLTFKVCNSKPIIENLHYLNFIIIIENFNTNNKYFLKDLRNFLKNILPKLFMY